VDPIPLLKGAAIGVAVAAPVGPMSVLCMRRTLTLGWRSGFSTGLGIASGDGVYASIAALGLAQVSRFMLAYDRPLHVLAGLFLVFLGARTLFAQPAGEGVAMASLRTPSGYASAFLLTLTNPPTIISFAAIFTALAPRGGFQMASSFEMVAGVFIGSSLWWLVLTASLAALRHAVGPKTRRFIDYVSGAVLSLLGIAEIKRAL
jgi:threonine/homoserine/homoserine lactone efflux protein